MPEAETRPVSIPNSTSGIFREEYVTFQEAISRVTPEYCAEIIQQYKEWHNLGNETHGGKLSHNTLTDGLYSRYNLPVLMTMYQWANCDDNPRKFAAQADTAMAIYGIGRALSVLQRYIENSGLTPSAAFADMRAASLMGDPTFSVFLREIREARLIAAIAIYNHREKIPETTPLPFIKNMNGDTFSEMAQKALTEFRESEEGVDMGIEFTKRLNDPSTRVVVLSLDINSTLNVQESYASLPVLDSVTAQLQALADRFKQIYPDKQLYIVLNTGRPDKYAWGVWEMLPPIPEIRRFALAESGGTILHLDGNTYTPEVAVPRPALWQEQLDNLKNYLAAATQSRSGFIRRVEKKESMLSVQIAERHEDGGKFLHIATDGETVTDVWIMKKVHQFLEESEAKYRHELDELEAQIKTIPHAVDIIHDMISTIGQEGLDKLSGTEDDLLPEVTAAIQKIIDDSDDHRAHRMKEVSEALETIVLMKTKLLPRFNATAGFMDIGHGDLNKFSTLVNEIRKDGFDPQNMLIIHVGDSSTDILPEDQTGKGEINEGANQAYLVALANSSESLLKAVEKRGKTGFGGIRTSREAILGLSDTILGILRAIPYEDEDYTTISFT